MVLPGVTHFQCFLRRLLLQILYIYLLFFTFISCTLTTTLYQSTPCADLYLACSRLQELGVTFVTVSIQLVQPAKVLTSFLSAHSTSGTNIIQKLFVICIWLNSRETVKATTWPSADPNKKPIYLPAGVKSVCQRCTNHIEWQYYRVPYSVMIMQRCADL